jgi:hypothetical protein
MATLVKETVSVDQNGFVTTERVYEAFTVITPSSSARTSSQSVTDGKYTLTEVFTDQVDNPNPGPDQPPKVYPETWSCEVSTSAEPIETHPMFAGIPNDQWELYRKWKNGVNLDTWNPSMMTSPGYRLAEYNSKGTTSYLAPKIVIKHTFSSTSKANLNNLGKREFPSFAGGLAPSGVDFILSGASVVQEGSLYKNSYEWIGSSLGGWDPIIYPSSS